MRVQPLRQRHELGEASAQPRFPALERCGHLADIVFEVQNRAVIEEASPLRVEANHFQVVAHAAAGFAEDAPQYRGLDQNGRAHIKPKPLLLQHRGLTTQPWILFEDFDLVAARSQRTRRRKSS